MSTSTFRNAKPQDLLDRDHTLHSAILYGLDGFIVELQARAVKVLSKPVGWGQAVRIVGMPRGAIAEVMDRICSAFAKFRIPEPQVEIVVNLAPADLPKEGTWLDLPIAIILLQAAGFLPDLSLDNERKIVLTGELGPGSKREQATRPAAARCSRRRRRPTCATGTARAPPSARLGRRDMNCEY